MITFRTEIVDVTDIHGSYKGKLWNWDKQVYLSHYFATVCETYTPPPMKTPSKSDGYVRKIHHYIFYSFL